MTTAILCGSTYRKGVSTMKKRMVMTLLSIVMATMAWLSVSVWAAPTSGVCGTSAFWDFDPSTRILTISGTGEMELDGDRSPWYDLRKEIIHIRVEEGITGICNRAFEHCQAAEIVDLPDSIRKIGGRAFSDCRAMLVADLNDDIHTIGSYAFYGCSGLKKVEIPAAVTEIASATFSNCSKLTEVVFHDGVKTIGSQAFQSTALSSITIPDSVTLMENSAFQSCYHLSDVVLGRGLTEISGNAFSECDNLRSIEIPDNITRIGHAAFIGCERLSKVVLGAGVREVETQAFWQCPAMSAFYVKEENPYLREYGGVLYDKEKSELLMFPWDFSGSHSILSGTKKISAHAGYERVGLKSVTLPDSIVEIGKYAFCGCEKIKDIRMPEGLEVVGELAFDGTSISRFHFPSTVRKIGTGLFNVEVEVQEVVFLGVFPKLLDGYLTDVRCKVYYPAHDPSWEKKLDYYGGIPKWTPVVCTGDHRTITEEGKDATCTESGLSDSGYCAYCGQVTARQETLPAAGHSYGPWEPVPEAETMEERTCKVCKATERREIPEEPVTQPTQPVTKPTEPVTQATVPEPVPTEPATEPVLTGPETIPSEPAAQPTEPETVPSEAATAPTELETVPTEPSAAPTQPSAETTVPETQPTQQPQETEDAPNGGIWLIAVGLFVTIAAGGWGLIRKKK